MTAYACEQTSFLPRGNCRLASSNILISLSTQPNATHDDSHALLSSQAILSSPFLLSTSYHLFLSYKKKQSMSRSSFFPPNRNRDSSPLLGSRHLSNISLSNIAPQDPRSQTASISPPPSFYRDNNKFSDDINDRHFSPSPSTESRSPDSRRSIRFAPPPPPVTSLYLPPRPQNDGAGSRSPLRRSLHPAESQALSQSTLHIRHSSKTRSAPIADPLLALQRRERAIQKDLQAVLDAQSTGLLQGFGGSNDAASEAGSSTPTMSQSRISNHSGSNRERNKGVVPVRQPKKKPLGLRGARRAIGRDIEELIAVKGSESEILAGEITQREEMLQKVHHWESSISNAKTKLTGGGESEDREISELKGEEQAVEKEIQELEDRLLQMRARRKWLAERVREEENKREARLSSYKGALREVELDVEGFLRHPPLEISLVMGDERGFTTLPESRRTLGMAHEWWSKELSALSSRKAAVEEEHTALEEGRAIWEGCIQQVMEFEDNLRSQMISGEPQSATILQKQIDKMGTVISKLDISFKIAEERGWNLLICAIGAELEAFREGHAILKGALNSIAPEDRSLTTARNRVRKRCGR